jgi:hypothetical protein
MTELLTGGLHGLVVLVTAVFAAPLAALVFYMAWRCTR